MKSLLIVYPHGLGDCIMLTPAIRNYFFQTGMKPTVAIMERFRSSEIFDNNPYIEEILYTKDPWNDYPDRRIGFGSVFNDCKEWSNDRYEVIMPMHEDRTKNKIEANLEACEIDPSSDFTRPWRPMGATETFSAEYDVENASNLVKDIVRGGPFGFVQTATGRPNADLPKGYGREWLRIHKGLTNVLEVGIDFKYDEFSINTQIEIMRMASAVCLPDSVFSNACGAIGKPIDHLYFAPQWGPQGYARVKPLHQVEQHVIYELDHDVMEAIQCNA